MAARIDEIAQDVADALEAAWPVGDTPIPVFAVVNEIELDLVAMSGRYVYVVPGRYAGLERVTRGEEATEYEIGVVFFEMSTTAGAPTKAWVEERRELVEQNLFVPLDNTDTYLVADLEPDTVTVETMTDRDLLSRGVFASELVITYIEIT